MALDVAPGLGRISRSSASSTSSGDVWLPIRQAAEARRQPPRKLAIYGSDILESQQRKAFVNLRSAGLEGCVEVIRADLLDLQAPAPAGVLAANCPTACACRTRLSWRPSTRYWVMPSRPTGRAGAATSSPASRPLPKGVRLKASKRTLLFNGAIECRLFEYQMIAVGQEAGNQPTMPRAKTRFPKD